MKRIAFVTILLAVTTMAQATVQYRLTFTKDATNWYLYTEAVSQTDNVGLMDFVLDVVGLPGTTITGSTLMAPRYLDMSLGDFCGFKNITNDGLNGVEISAAQSAGVYWNLANPWANLETIWHIGQSPGSGGSPPNDATWGVPCLLAAGTYVGLGEFAYANARGSAAIAIAYGYDIAPKTPVQFIPEPATLGLFALAGARVMARRRR